jgi:hypothetical protein
MTPVARPASKAPALVCESLHPLYDIYTVDIWATLKGGNNRSMLTTSAGLVFIDGPSALLLCMYPLIRNVLGGKMSYGMRYIPDLMSSL